MQYVFRIGGILTSCEDLSLMIGGAVAAMQSQRSVRIAKISTTRGMYGSVVVEPAILLSHDWCELYMGKGTVLKEVGSIRLSSEGEFTFYLHDICGC